MIFALIFLVLILIIDMIKGYLTQISPDILYEFAKTLGSVGLILIITAILFYPLRKIGKYYRKKLPVLSHPLYMSIAKITALLHPLIALFAFVILFLHGYILLVVISDFYFDSILLAGSLALSILFLLFTTGSFLKKNLSSKKIRIFHFSISFVFIATLSIHLILMR